MATRFRLTNDATAPAVSPALQSYSHNAPTTVRRKLLTSDASALTTTAYTPDASDHTSAGDSLWCQFVSDPMAAGHLFASGQTIKMAMQCLEPDAKNNLFLQLYVAIVSSDGATVRRVLRSKVLDDVEINATIQNRFLTTTQDGADYTTQASDRLVVEISASGTPGTGSGVQGHNGSMRFGGAGASGDLGENDTDTGTTLNPWVEFVPSDLFTEAHSGTFAVSHAHSTSDAGSKQGKGATTVSHAHSTTDAGAKATSGAFASTNASAVTPVGRKNASSAISAVTHAHSTSTAGRKGGQAAFAISHAHSTSDVGVKQGLAVLVLSHAHSIALTGVKGGQGPESHSGTFAVSTTHATSAAGRKDTHASIAVSHAHSIALVGHLGYASSFAVSHSASVTSAGVADKQGAVSIALVHATTFLASPARQGAMLVEHAHAIAFVGGRGRPGAFAVTHAISIAFRGGQVIANPSASIVANSGPTASIVSTDRQTSVEPHDYEGTVE